MNGSGAFFPRVCVEPHWTRKSHRNSLRSAKFAAQLHKIIECKDVFLTFFSFSPDGLMYRVRLHKGMAFLQIFNHHLVWPPSSIDTLHKRGVQCPGFVLCTTIICPEQNTGCCIENYTLYETARHIAGQSACDPLMPKNYVIRFVIGDAGWQTFH